MELEDNSIYKNLISHIDINRGINSIQYVNFRDVNNELLFREFINDASSNNDAIELNLINNKAYKEAVIMSLHINRRDYGILLDMIKSEQKTFGGSKLFYLNDAFDKILVVSVPRSTEGKLSMVINRLNKVNEKIARLNLRIKKENMEIYMKRESKDKKDTIINMINRELRV